MKKLVIALSAIALAVGAQAATVSWGSGTMKLPNDAGVQTSSATTKINASLYLISESVYTTLLAGLSSTETFAETVETIYTGAGKGTYGELKASAATQKGARTLTDGVDYAANTTVYGLLLYTYSDTVNEKVWAIANVGSATVETVDQTVAAMGLFVGNATSGTTMKWTAVPEPTSGLLLLLGMAGLALKRKRA